MISCVTAFMMWLSTYENYNSFHWGSYGWFMVDEDEPMSGWFTFQKDVKMSEGVYRYKDETTYFSIIKNKNKVNKMDETLQNKRCKLDGKTYWVYETLSYGKDDK